MDLKSASNNEAQTISFMWTKYPITSSNYLYLEIQNLSPKT